MANQKFLYGQLNQPNSSSANYGGVTTDTAKVTVDNQNRTIRADVLWNAFTGETSDKAYPGDKGARNYQKIIELQSKLNEENLRFIGYKDSIEAQLAKISNDLNKLTIESKQAIQTESNRSKLFDDDIYAKLKSEIDRATKAENDLLTQLLKATSDWKKVTEDIQSQIQDLDGVSSDVIESIQTDLSEEIERSKKADAELSIRLTEESERAKEAESLITEKLIQTTLTEKQNHADVINALENEITLRETTVHDTNVRIDQEVERSLRVESDLAELLRTQNKSLSYQRQNLDELTVQFTDHEERINSVETRTTDLEKEIDDLTKIASKNSSDLDETLTQVGAVGKRIEASEKQLNQISNTLERTIDSTNTSLDVLTKRVDRAEAANSSQQESIMILNGRVDNEKKLREQSLSSLETRIDVESGRAVKAEEQLQKSITSLQKKTIDDFSRLTSDYESLENNNANDHARMNNQFDTILWNHEQFEQDVNHRFADLDEVVDDLNDKVNNIEVDGVVEIQPQVTEDLYVYGQHKETVKMLHLDVESTSDSIVQRDSDGNVILPATVGPLNGAVSRSYVDKKLEDVIGELDSIVEKMINIEFIDGGTAPINRK